LKKKKTKTQTPPSLYLHLPKSQPPTNQNLPLLLRQLFDEEWTIYIINIRRGEKNYEKPQVVEHARKKSLKLNLKNGTAHMA
jgi:hypothetical protein